MSKADRFTHYVKLSNDKVLGVFYQIDLEGSPTSEGTLNDPYLRGIYNSSGILISGTTDDDGGTSRNSQLSYTATSTGTHYISVPWRGRQIHPHHCPRNPRQPPWTEPQLEHPDSENNNIELSAA